MKVPQFVHSKMVDQSGYPTPSWEVYISQLEDQLQQNFSNEGIVTPSQNTANTSVIEPQASVGTLLFDSESNKLLVKLNDGTFHQIMTV